MVNKELVSTKPMLSTNHRLKTLTFISSDLTTIKNRSRLVLKLLQSLSTMNSICQKIPAKFSFAASIKVAAQPSQPFYNRTLVFLEESGDMEEYYALTLKIGAILIFLQKEKRLLNCITEVMILSFHVTMLNNLTR